MSAKPFIWQMIKEAVENSTNKEISYKEIKSYINKKWPGENNNTINCQIIVCTINAPSRVYYTENYKPRIADGRYDFLFTIGRGVVQKYDPSTHGIWEIHKNELGKLQVRKVDDAEDITEPDAVGEVKTFTFALESHLRDFIAQHLSHIDENLSLYVSDEGVSGVEYKTGVGFIDILTQNKHDEFVIIELKLSRGIDAALGQLQRYMGWVKKNLSEPNKTVHGIIIAENINDKLKYAVSVANNISLFEYEMAFNTRKAELEQQ